MPGAYEVAVHVTTGAAAGPIATITTAAGQQCRVLEIGVFNTSGTAGEPGLGIPAAVGTGTLTGPLVQALDPSDVAGVTTLVTSFGTAQPTAPTNPFKRVQIGSVVGAGVVWVYPDNQLVIPVSKQVTIWQFSTTATSYDVYVKLMGG